MCVLVFFFKQKTAYEMRISDWSSDVCSSDLIAVRGDLLRLLRQHAVQRARQFEAAEIEGLAAAHVDLAGDSALDHVGGAGLVDLQRGDRAGGEVLNLDVAAFGGEDLAAVIRGRQNGPETGRASCGVRVCRYV